MTTHQCRAGRSRRRRRRPAWAAAGHLNRCPRPGSGPAVPHPSCTCRVRKESVVECKAAARLHVGRLAWQARILHTRHSRDGTAAAGVAAMRGCNRPLPRSSLGVELVQHSVQRLVVGDLEAAQHDALSHVVQAHVPVGQAGVRGQEAGVSWLAGTWVMSVVTWSGAQLGPSCAALPTALPLLTCCYRRPAGRSRRRRRPGW